MSHLYIILVNTHLSFVLFVIWIDAYKWEQNICIISNSGYIFCAIPACEAVVLFLQCIRFEEVWGLEKENRRDGVECGVGLVRKGKTCMHMMFIFLEVSHPWVTTLFSLNFASNKFGKNYEPNFVSVIFCEKGRIGVFQI